MLSKRVEITRISTEEPGGMPIQTNVKGVGTGVFECRADFGPGYRIYFGKDGDRLVILLGGGSKSRQSRDVAAAQERWADYKRRKKREVN